MLWMHHKFAAALLLVLAALSFPRVSKSVAIQSRTPRTEESSASQYVGHTNRASALRLVCDKVRQAVYDEVEENYYGSETTRSIWAEEDVLHFTENLSEKPITSKSHINQ